MYQRVVVSPGVGTALGGPEGGTLLGLKSGPGSLTLSDIWNKTWTLLREPGPDQGYPIDTSKNFLSAMITRDANIICGQFVGETGMSQSLTEVVGTFPVFPLLDYPLPLDCSSLMRVEYTPAGQQTYKLIGLSQEEFDNITGDILPNATGQPYYYRRPFAGYIRLMPQPQFGNYVGNLGGSFTLAGAPTPGDTIHAQFTYLSTTVTTASYTVQVGDNLGSVAFQLSQLINGSAAVIGTGPNEPFLANASPDLQVVNLTMAPNIPLSAVIDYIGVTSSTTMTITPFVSPLQMVPIGDTITFYYNSLGVDMTLPGDTPRFPSQFHIAVVYRLLADYWAVKQDLNQSGFYLKKYQVYVDKAKAYKFDVDQSSQFTLGGNDDTDFYGAIAGAPW